MRTDAVGTGREIAKGKLMSKEQKPSARGERLGELSPHMEWVWLGDPAGWVPADVPVNREERKLDE